MARRINHDRRPGKSHRKKVPSLSATPKCLGIPRLLDRGGIGGGTISSPSAWRPLIETPAPGDHILFWTDDSASSDSIMATFVQGGLHRNDLVAVLWPHAERDSLRRQCQATGVSLDEHIVRGNVTLMSAERYYPHDPHDETRIESLFDQLTDRVRAGRKSGLSFMGRIAPSLFERGDMVRAETVERMVGARLGTARVLCPYRAKRVGRLAGAPSLVRSHSHTVTALGRDQFLVEHVASRHRS